MHSFINHVWLLTLSSFLPLSSSPWAAKNTSIEGFVFRREQGGRNLFLFHPSSRPKLPNTPYIAASSSIPFLCAFCPSDKKRSDKEAVGAATHHHPSTTTNTTIVFVFLFLYFSQLINPINPSSRWFFKTKIIPRFFKCWCAVSHLKLPENEPIFESRSRSYIKGEYL